MRVKLFIVCALAVVVIAREYPAGIDAAMCLNYPFCDHKMASKLSEQSMPMSGWVHNPRMLYMARNIFMIDA
ncbi:unnamed protein product [Leptidea sinapis]|uniref:Cuticle protein CPCFC domain-containing protein n=1 Tax=Leptidea sinapis TaxID=189913 RepID=A0A5E4PW98_9NEOP|nr:unnamed protein product [Leptidea sinapis]